MIKLICTKCQDKALLRVIASKDNLFIKCTNCGTSKVYDNLDTLDNNEVQNGKK